MATSEYYTWLKRGQPYVLTRPARDIQGTIKRYGITVYDYPNETHLRASKPEDHTPFSYTKWPNVNRNIDGVGRAIDIMPRVDTAVARSENANIARQLIKDKDVNTPGTEGIKYLNWTDEEGVCRQENWKSGKRVTVSSSDKGHIHVSFRNDTDDMSAVGYDPVARMYGQVHVLQEEDMPFVAKDANTGQYYVCDLITSRPVSSTAVADVLYLARQLNYGHGTGSEWTDNGWTRLGWNEAAFGTLQKTVDKITAEVSQEVVQDALESDRGQAALERAANAAEDS